MVYAEGNADAYVYKGAAMAIAKSEGGEAAVWSDGKRHEMQSEGTGLCIAGEGWAVAMAGKDNRAAAYSYQANKNSLGLPSTGNRYAITDSSDNKYNTNNYNSNNYNSNNYYSNNYYNSRSSNNNNNKSYRCCGGAGVCSCNYSCRCSCDDCFCS